MPVAVSPVLIQRRKRSKEQFHQGARDEVACQCAKCLRKGTVWPSYYVRLMVSIPSRSAPPKAWTVRAIALDCFLELSTPGDAPDCAALLPPTTAEQAMDEGLDVRDRSRRSVWAPLMEGACEACGDLRVTRRRFCLACAALAADACRRCGWSEDTIAAFLAAPANGRDAFADAYDVATPPTT